MAITTLKTPAAYVPVATPAYWTASSSQSGQPNFKYRVIFTDVISGNTYQKDYDKRPSDSKLVFDSNFFAELYIVNFVPNNAYGFQLCAGAIRQIRVNIGELYGSGTPVYYAGSNQTYIVWNGTLDELDVPDYVTTNYVYKSSTSNWKFISSYDYSGFTPRYKLDNNAYTDKSSFIYCLSSEADDLEAIGVKCYDLSGSLIQQSRILNPYSGTTTYTNQYVCIDVGRKGLDNISSGLVQLSYPIIPSNCHYYEIEDIGISGDEPPFTYTTRKIIQRLYVTCEAKYEVYTLQYLAKNGNFETCHFPKVSTINIEVIKSIYNQNPYMLNASNEYTFTKFTPQERIYASTVRESVMLQSDWLTYEQIFAHSGLIESSQVYFDFGSTIGLVPCIVDRNSFAKIKRFNKEEPHFQVTARKGHSNRRQRG
jgi:hypothetical protein